MDGWTIELVHTLEERDDTTLDERSPDAAQVAPTTELLHDDPRMREEMARRHNTGHGNHLHSKYAR
jgi:hypothetical protein